MTDSATYQLDVQHDRLIVTFLPELNKIPWADIESVGTQVVNRLQTVNHPKVIVDLTPLDYMGSAQVALIVRIFKSVKEHQGSMIVCAQHPVVQEVLTLAGLNKIWTIVRSRDDALSRFGRGHEQQASPSPWPLVFGVVAALLAGISLIAVYNQLGLPTRTGLLMALVASLVTFGLGLLSTLKSHGKRQLSGVAILIVGVGLMLGSVFSLAAPPAGRITESPENTSSDDESSSESTDTTLAEGIEVDPSEEVSEGVPNTADGTKSTSSLQPD